LTQRKEARLKDKTVELLNDDELNGMKITDDDDVEQSIKVKV
jgi:hypothetical protein